MKTFGEITTVRVRKPDWWYFLVRNWDELNCFLWEHKWKWMSDIYGNFKGDRICRRCHRAQEKGGFYHNWEMDRGPAARCHDHTTKEHPPT